MGIKCVCLEGFVSIPGSDPTHQQGCIATAAPTERPTRAPTGTPTRQPSEEPTQEPTSLAPTLMPTNPPTIHPCDDGSNDCDTGSTVCVKSNEANQCRFLTCDDDLQPINLLDDDWSVINVPDDDAGPVIQECHACQQVQDGVCVGPPIDTSIVVGQMGTPTAAASYELLNCTKTRPTIEELEERLEVYYHKIEGPSYCEPWDKQEAHSEAAISPEACKAACLAKASCGAINWFPQWPVEGDPINCFFFPTCDTQNPSNENGQVYIKQVFKAPMTPSTPPPSPSPTLEPTASPTTPIVAIPEPPSKAPTVHTDVEPTSPPSIAPTAPPTPSFVDFFIGIPTETVDSYTSAKQSTLQRSLSAVLDVDETEIALFITDADDAINQGSETIGTLNGQLRRLRSNRKLADQLQQTGIAVRVKIESPSVGDDATNDLKNVVGKIDSDDFISHLISTVEVLQSITGPEASIQASEMTYEQNCVETTGSLPCMTGSADLTLGNNGFGDDTYTYDADAIAARAESEPELPEWADDASSYAGDAGDDGAAEAPVPAPAPSDDGSSYTVGAVEEAGLTEADVAATGGDVGAALAAAPASTPVADVGELSVVGETGTAIELSQEEVPAAVEALAEAAAVAPVEEELVGGTGSEVAQEEVAPAALRQLAAVGAHKSSTARLGEPKSIFANTVVLAAGFAAVAIALVGYIRSSASAKAVVSEGDMEMQVRDC